MDLLEIARADDPRLAEYRDVKDPRWLREAGIFLAEGRRTVAALLRAPGFRARSLLVTEPACEGVLRELGPALGAAPVYRVPVAVMEEVSGVRFHQGCVAAAERSRIPSASELIAAGGRRFLVLEGLSDPDNVGGLFRSARAFACDAVLLGSGCASPLYRKSVRTSMGASLEVPFAQLDDWPADLARLRRAGIRVLGLSPEADGPDVAQLASAAPGRVALVLGAEGEGLSPATRAELDACLHIPMAAGVDSLNVAAAGAIALQRLFAESR